MGLLERAAPGVVRDGRERRHPAHAAEPRVHGRPGARRRRRGANNWGVIGISRDQWRLVATAAALGGNVRVGLEDNFYLPGGRDGALERRPDRPRPPAGGGRGPARGHAWPRRASCSPRPLREVARVSGALEGVEVLDLSRLLPGGFCSLLLADFGAEVLKVEDTGMGDYIRWATPVPRGRRGLGQVGAVPRPQPRQALDPAEPQGGARARGAAASSCASTTCCSSRSARGCSTGSAWATSACARRTRGSCTARSRATGRTAPTRRAPGHDMNYLGPGRAARADAASAAARPCRPPGRSPTSAAAR